MINMDKFIEVVRNMRTSQKEYFKFRSQTALKDAKYWEREVDQFLAISDKNEENGPKQDELFSLTS